MENPQIQGLAWWKQYYSIGNNTEPTDAIGMASEMANPCGRIDHTYETSNRVAPLETGVVLRIRHPPTPVEARVNRS